MLINGRRDTIKNSQTERSETLFKNASTGTRKSTTRDFDLLVFNHLANHNWYANYATHPIAHDEMTWHAGRYKQLKKNKKNRVVASQFPNIWDMYIEDR